MKKIIKILLISIITLVGIFIIRNNTCREISIKDYEKYDIFIKIPYSYEIIRNEKETNLFDLYSKKTGLSIVATALKYDFWSSGDIHSRMDEYLKLVSAANYEAQLTNPKISVIEQTDNKFGRVELELTKNDNDNAKTITLIANGEIGNLVIEFTGTIENINNNIKEIERIIDTIQIKEK